MKYFQVVGQLKIGNWLFFFLFFFFQMQCYWFTVEYGMCRQGGELKAYGAGLLSSFGELEYCLSSEPEIRTFDPVQTALQKYPITQYQPVYYVADSFDDAKDKMMYVSQVPKTYNLDHINIILVVQ